MKVKIISDIHMEFDEPNSFDFGTGDVLVMAGDIAPICDYDLHRDTYNRIADSYKKVFYVIGNHEYYGGDFKNSFYELKAQLPSNIRLLHNSSEYYDGIHFVGGTLWTDQNNKNFDDMLLSQQCMNDYNLIQNGFNKLNVLETVEENLLTVDWFEKCLPTLKQGDVFMITHHPPSQQSVKGRYTENRGAYGNSLESFIKKHSNVKWWAHGHCHISSDYMIEQCRIIANPRGYHNYEENPNFTTKEIEL